MIHVSKCYYCGDYFDSADAGLTWLDICSKCEGDELEYIEQTSHDEHEGYVYRSLEEDELEDISVKWAHEEDDE